MIGTLNKTKHCNMCNTTKEVTQFYKKTALSVYTEELSNKLISEINFDKLINDIKSAK